MIYRNDKYGKSISQLGYGCMRFTKKGNAIDYDKAEKEIMSAIKKGVNYFDTAFIYPGSEECLGKILDENDCREDVYIATKLPHYLIKTMDGVEKTFQEELKRLQTDYVDFYLLHALGLDRYRCAGDRRCGHGGCSDVPDKGARRGALFRLETHMGASL